MPTRFGGFDRMWLALDLTWLGFEQVSGGFGRHWRDACQIGGDSD